MDDMYQYAASAVNNNSNTNSNDNQVNEEDDVILKAFNNMGWGKKWTSLVDTVKKSSEAFVEGTKKDLQEMAHIIADETEEEQQATARNIEQDNTALDSIRENLAKINTVHFTSLRDGLSQTLNQTLPAQIKSVRLPENMDLTQLKEGLANGTRSAEHYLQQFGTEVISALKGTVTVLEPEQIEQQEQVRGKSPLIYATRKEALIAKMQNDEDTFLKDPETSIKDNEQEKKILETFNHSFNIEEYTEEIAELLNEHNSLRDTMDKLVPIQISYTLFWQRYFYHSWKIDQDEQKRQLIVQQHQEDEGDFKWDSDDEDNHTVTANVKERTSISNSEDTDDFSNISAPSPPLKTEDEWVEAEKKKSDNDESDSDWE